MRSLSLRPDDLLNFLKMALSIDSMHFVSSTHAIAATGFWLFSWWVYVLPLNTSAFLWTYHAVANTPAGLLELVRSYCSTNFGLPRNRGGSAPALTFSRPAQRSLTLRPVRLPSRL